MKGFFTGFDLGGTKMYCLLVREDGRIVERLRAKTQAGGSATRLVDGMVASIDELLARASLDRSQLSAVGIGAPGAVDFENGIVLNMPNLGLTDLPLKKLLQQRLKLPVLVENDVNAGTWAEFAGGAAKGCRHVVGIFPGTGIGGGLILDGRLYRGAGGGAGEIGHTIVQLDGRECACGQHDQVLGEYGCLEALASRTAIAKDLVVLAATGRAPSVLEDAGTDYTKVKSGVIARAVKSGNADVIRLVARAARFLGVGMANCVNIFNPELIVIGGGLVEKLGETYLREAEKSMRAHALSGLVRKVKVVQSVFGDDAVALGASLLAAESKA
jgi:glucokinase